MWAQVSPWSDTKEVGHVHFRVKRCQGHLYFVVHSSNMLFETSSVAVSKIQLLLYFWSEFRFFHFWSGSACQYILYSELHSRLFSFCHVTDFYTENLCMLQFFDDHCIAELNSDIHGVNSWPIFFLCSGIQLISILLRNFIQDCWCFLCLFRCSRCVLDRWWDQETNVCNSDLVVDFSSMLIVWGRRFAWWGCGRPRSTPCQMISWWWDCCLGRVWFWCYFQEDIDTAKTGPSSSNNDG